MALGYVSPSTNIVMLKNCVLQKSDNDETDTLLFSGVEEQEQYFETASNFSAMVQYSNNTYQNVGKGVLRLGATMKEALGYNYMYFSNNDGVVFEGKRYYCFVDDIRYINNNCVEISYSLDYLQTFMFDYREKTCFVERMTTDDDAVGTYVLDEGLDLGSELKVLKVDEVYFNTWAYFVLFGYTDSIPNKRVRLDTSAGAITYLKGVFTDFDYTTNSAKYFNELMFSVPNGLLSNNMPIFVQICTGVRQYRVIDGGVNPPVIDTSSATVITFGVTVDSWMVFGKIFTGRGICDKDSDYNSENAVTDYERLISCVYSATLCPSAFTNLGAGGVTEYSVIDSSFFSGKSPGTDTGEDCLHSIDGYTPKNNKLFTYPYVYLLAGSSEGETQEYRFEWFNSEYKYYEFELSACAVPMPICCMTPKNYYLGDGVYNQMSGVVISNFQQIPLFTDSYKEYVAKNRYRDNIAMTNAILNGVNNTVSPIVSSAVTGDLQLATPVGVSSVLSASQNALSTAKDIYQNIFEVTKRYEVARLTPPGLIGQIGTPDLKVFLNKFGYYLLTMGIDYEHARVIDDYFTRYGYKLARSIEPSRNNNGKRKNFTFIKTVECNIGIRNNNMMQDDEKAIEAIYNRGVRFWYGRKNGVRMYKDYSENNPIVS